MNGSNPSYRTEHTATVAGSSDLVFDLVADVRRWPVIFGPTIYVEHFGSAGERERFQLWALVNGQVSTWTSSRVLEADARRISFAQDRSQSPVASMTGEWLFRPRADGSTEVVLRHEFSVVDDAPEAVAWVTEALDRNSEAELGALGRIAGFGHSVGELLFSFEDTAGVPGAAADAYEFVDRADRWVERLPHVRRATLTEDEPGIQTLEMETVTSEGSAHTTRSVRVCRKADLIAYKQLVPPRLLLGHSGTWTFAERDGDAVMTARHQVAIDPAVAVEQFGPVDALAKARAYVREALGGNSRATLAQATDFAVARRTGNAAR